jgi:hypothetical protein
MEDGEPATGWLLDVFEDWNKLPDRYALIVTDADDVASCVAEAEQALGQWHAMVTDESPRLARACNLGTRSAAVVRQSEQ